MEKQKHHNRAPGKTQISISLPTDLVDRIDELARADNRNRSNFIATQLDLLSRRGGSTSAESPNGTDGSNGRG